MFESRFQFRYSEGAETAATELGYSKVSIVLVKIIMLSENLKDRFFLCTLRKNRLKLKVLLKMKEYNGVDVEISTL